MRRSLRVLAAATREIEIGKTGFERFVAMAAERYAFLRWGQGALRNFRLSRMANVRRNPAKATVRPDRVTGVTWISTLQAAQ